MSPGVCRGSRHLRTICGLRFALLLALTACGGGEESGPCTLIACFHGLLVTVANPPAEPYRIEATAAGETTAQVQNCATGGQCFILFNNFFPDRVTINLVVTASGNVARTADVSPSYATQQPNGPGCGTCRNATVDL